MKNNIIPGAWVLAVAVATCCSGCSRQLTGTVFIVTEGAQTFRLPLTTVEVVKAEEFRKYCKSTEAELEALQASQWKSLAEKSSKQSPDFARFLTERASEEYTSTLWSFYIGQKPNSKVPPVGTAQTDADGKFRIQVQESGDYLVKARAQRSIGAKLEYYRWIVPITISAMRNATLDLSNQNLANEASLAGLLNRELLELKKPESKEF